jgi:xylan 1,4-beta-xylosidase
MREDEWIGKKRVAWHTLVVCLVGTAFLRLLLGITASHAQQPVPSTSVRVYFDQPDGPLVPVWNYFGFDEPNYAYAPNGQKLLGELGHLSSQPVYIRVHNLFTSGDGGASLKWGSTNVYTEDDQGNPVYSWTILDRIFDAFRAADVKPLVELGFMPQALSIHPEPYRHHFPDGSIFTGWAYPPKDYQAWAELVFQFVRHLRERYGDAEVRTWLWEVWNEPDIDYWKGTPEEYFELYDYSADAVVRALPEARIGGPDTTGPRGPKAAEFLRRFLEHCAHGRNSRTGRTGTRLDFISFHPKGSPKWLDDHVEMGIASQLAAIQEGFHIVASFPEWRQTPIILGESDPEGCAACSARNNPQYGYRNGALYATYEAEVLHDTYALARLDDVHLIGAVTWAFEFEGQPYFAGFRELASNGLDKPVLNAFRMFGLLGNERLKLSSSGALKLADIVASGVRGQPDINAIATRSQRSVEVLLWNYHDDDRVAPDAPLELTIVGLPARGGRLEHFRVDSAHSNSFEFWKEMGSPEPPSAKQREQLEDAGQLHLLTSPAWVKFDDGNAHLTFNLPRKAVSLVRIAW